MITKNHTIELKDTSVSEMARFRQIMLGIWSQQKEDDKNTDNMETFINNDYKSSNAWIKDSKEGNPVYSIDGEYLGNNSRISESKDLTFIGEKDGKGGFKNLQQLKDKHSKFILKASTVYGESSAYKSNMTEDLRKEMFAIASVFERNSIAYGENSELAKKFRSTSKEKRDGTKMQYAIAAEINVLTNGFDYSYGADAWDGQEQAMFNSNDYRFSTGTFELHKNTLGWTISDEHYKIWAANVGKNFDAPQISFTPYSNEKFNKYYKEGRINLKSTAVYNKTIFWKTLKGKDIIKAYPWNIPNRPAQPGFLDNFKK
ncbi:hypothetical protein [Flavobacterium sp. N502536]|uniref:hypothetical protein n=1 Tax=Flavobacterium sp. N502536 TaxID=2986837 RepID=UPI00222246F3|nr:hypothetical protein [Flavobacterium sp. N502536]